MKFNFIHSKKGYGKTKYILEDISKNQEENIIIFVPSHNTFMIENRLINYFGEEIFSRVEVMDFKKLTSRFLNMYKKFKNNRISDMGKRLLINYILRNNIKNLSYFNFNTKIDFSSEILSTLIDFKNYNFNNEMIDGVLKNLNEDNELYKKLKDFKIINRIYERHLDEKYLDPLDEMIIINLIVKNNKKMFEGYKFYIDGFEIFTYYQYEFLKIIIERAREINLSLSFDKNFDNKIYSHIKKIKDNVIKILFDNNFYDINEVYLTESDKNDELKHLDENYLKYKPMIYKNIPQRISINKCLNNFYEVEQLCKKIRDFVINKGYRFKDIGVLCRDIDSYENFIRVCFEEFDIPYFIDKKNKINSNIFVIFLNSIFEVYKYKFSYNSIFKYIKSGLLNLSYDEIFNIENFSIENNITGYRWTDKFNEYSKVNYSMNSVNNIESLNEIESTREKIITPLVNLFNEFKSKRKVNFFINKLYDFLEDNLIIKTLHDMCKKFSQEKNFIYADELMQSVNNIFLVFDEINNVFKDEEMEFLEFGEILMDSVLKIEISHVPMKIDEIMVGDVSRLMIGNYKALFVIGCTSTNFPKNFKKQEILSDIDKKYLRSNNVEFSITNDERNLSERYLMYSIINIPKDFLYISYSISDMEGLSLSPSIMISKIKQIFPCLKEENSNIVSKEFSLEDISSKRSTLNILGIKLRDVLKRGKKNEILESLYEFYKTQDEYSDKVINFFKNINRINSCENLRNDLVNKIYSTKYKFSISSIETYSKCSFKHFIDYVIRVKDRKVYGFDNIDCGNLMHFVMENALRNINKEFDFRNSSRDQINDFIDKYFEQNIFSDINKNYILNTSARFRVFGNKIKKIIKDCVFFSVKHLNNSEFFHKFYEFEIGNKNSKVEIEFGDGKKANFVGKIDRIDFCKSYGETFVNIIDYKSSVREFNYGNVYQNINIQTIAYMKYVLDIYRNFYNENIMPCGILYFTLHSPNVKDQDDNINNKIEKNYKYEGIFTNDIKRLSLMDKDLFNNTSNMLPFKFNKDKSFMNKGSIDKSLNDEEFNDLLNFVDDSVKYKLSKIFKGEIEISPILEKKSSNRCTNCSYLGICKFSKGLNSFKVLMNLRKEEFFNLIKELRKEN